MKNRWGMIVLAMTGTWIASSARGMVLAERTTAPAYTLVCPEKASPSQKYAAEEFRDFTEKLTGVRLQILSDRDKLPARAILLGDTPHGC